MYRESFLALEISALAYDGFFNMDLRGARNWGQASWQELGSENFSDRVMRTLCGVGDVDNIVIRKATPEDAEAACAVLVRSIKEICAPYYENDEGILAEWLENKTPANVRRWIESDRTYCVVAVGGNGQVVGFAAISGSEIVLNYVLPEALHQGAGKRMLQLLEAYAIACGLGHVDVVSTITAKAFYERNGYVSNGAPRQVGRILGDFPLVKTMR